MFIKKRLLEKKEVAEVAALPVLTFTEEEMLKHKLYYYQNGVDKVSRVLGNRGLERFYSNLLNHVDSDEVAHSLLQDLSKVASKVPEDLSEMNRAGADYGLSSWVREYKVHQAVQFARKYFDLDVEDDEIGFLYHVIGDFGIKTSGFPFSKEYVYEGTPSFSEEVSPTVEIDTFNMYLHAAYKTGSTRIEVLNKYLIQLLELEEGN